MGHRRVMLGLGTMPTADPPTKRRGLGLSHTLDPCETSSCIVPRSCYHAAKGKRTGCAFSGQGRERRLQMNGWLIEVWCPHCGHLIRCGTHGDRTESACLETPDARTYHKSRYDLFMKGLVDGCLKQRERAFLLPIRTPASDTRQTQDSEEAPNVTPTFMAARGSRAK